MYIPCEASSWTLIHQNRKLSWRISLQNQLFCLCRLPAVYFWIRISSISYDFWNELDRNAPKGANFQIWMFIFFIQLTCSWLMLVLMSYLWVNKANDLFYFEKRTQIPKCHIFGRHVCSFYFASNFDVFFPSFNLLSWDLAVICRRIFYTSYGQKINSIKRCQTQKFELSYFSSCFEVFFFFLFCMFDCLDFCCFVVVYFFFLQNALHNVLLVCQYR